MRSDHRSDKGSRDHFAKCIGSPLSLVSPTSLSKIRISGVPDIRNTMHVCSRLASNIAPTQLVIYQTTDKILRIKQRLEVCSYLPK